MKEPNTAGIAGLCFLACALICAVVVGQHLLLTHGPAVRAWLLAMLIPQFAVGAIFGALCALVSSRLINR